MALTPAQISTLRTNIQANTNQVVYAGVPTNINAVPLDSDGDAAIRDWYNQAASPAWTVWKTLVPIVEVGNAFNGTEFAGLTSLNVTRLQGIADYSAMGINPSLADRRQLFDDVFSGAGGATTRASLLVLWKVTVSNLLKLFSTGTGSNASPATVASNLSHTTLVSTSEINQARAS